MKWGRIWILVAIAAVAGERGHTGVGDGMGNIGGGSGNDDIALEVEANWQLPDFVCSRDNNRITVTRGTTPPPSQESLQFAPCTHRKMILTFTLTGGPNFPQTAYPHPITYTAECGPGPPGKDEIVFSVGFDEDQGSPIPLVRGPNQFLINGTSGSNPPDVLVIYVEEFGLNSLSGPLHRSVPALGEWGGITVALAIAGAGVLLILRRRRGATLEA